MRIREQVHRVISFVRASAWTSLVLKAAFFVGALFILAWIGRAATAATPVSPLSSTTNVTSALMIDASAPVQIVSTPPPPAPAPTLLATSPPAVGTRGRATPEDPVYLNHASTEEFKRLPGVGVKRAEAIVALRQRVGHFQRVEDLLRVKGIGRSTLRKWRPLVRLDSPPAPLLPTPTPMLTEDASTP